MSSDIEIQPAPAVLSPEEAAARLAETSSALAHALTVHAAAIVAARGDVHAYAAADEALAPYLVAVDEAYTLITGEVHPMRADEMYAQAGCGCTDCACAAGSDGTAGEPEAGQEAAQGAESTTVVSVYQRHDYAITSPEAVIAAGREAYLKTSPEATADEAEAEVSDVDLALLHLAHTDGWNALWQLEGLDAVGGVSGVFEQDEPLDGDSEEWADQVLGGIIDDSEPWFVQVDVYGD